jgi:hypothetical protein
MDRILLEQTRQFLLYRKAKSEHSGNEAHEAVFDELVPPRARPRQRGVKSARAAQPEKNHGAAGNTQQKVIRLPLAHSGALLFLPSIGRRGRVDKSVAADQFRYPGMAVSGK